MIVNRVLDYFYNALGIRSGRMVPALQETITPVIEVTPSIDSCLETGDRSIGGRSNFLAGGGGVPSAVIIFNCVQASPLAANNEVLPGIYVLRFMVWQWDLDATVPGSPLIPIRARVSHETGLNFITQLAASPVGSPFEWVINLQAGERVVLYVDSSIALGDQWAWVFHWRRVTGPRV